MNERVKYLLLRFKGIKIRIRKIKVFFIKCHVNGNIHESYYMTNVKFNMCLYNVYDAGF